jgi:hypothetical protein
MTTNSVSSLNPAFWAREAERSLFVENKAMAIANTTLRNLVAGEGDTVYKTIVSYPASSTYTPGSDITQTSVTGSRETLSIATWLASMVIIDDTEKAQSIIELGSNISNKMMKDHNNRIEQAILAEVSNAQWSLDAGNVGGIAGQNAVVNTNTVPQFFVAADTKLDAIDAPKAGRTAVIGGHFLGQLKLQQAARPGSVIADGVNTRGIVTSLFGWDIMYSNNLPWSGVITIGTNPAVSDTITIAGVKFTFNTTIGTTVAGTIKIADTVANTVANLVVVLNAVDTSIADTSTAGYLKVSAENIFLLRDKRRISAVATSASATTVSGYGDIVVAASMTTAANAWSAQKQTSLFCVSGCIDMIVQIPPKIEVIRSQKQFADVVKSMLGFGKKTYADGAREMVSVAIDASTSDWS